MTADNSKNTNNNSKHKINNEEIETNANKLKNKLTTDIQGWSNNILKNSGTDVRNSLKIILNEIEHIIPREWQELIMKSTYTNKGKKMTWRKEEDYL